MFENLQQMNLMLLNQKFTNKPNHQYNQSLMLNQERGIFKPTLKSHSLLANPSIKRYSFLDQSLRQDSVQQHLRSQYSERGLSYPQVDEKQIKHENGLWKLQQKSGQLDYQNFSHKRLQNQSLLTVTRFDPILPRFVFKRFLTQTQQPHNQNKHNNNQIIQPLKVKNVNYPFEVQKLIREAEQKKASYNKKFQTQFPLNMEQQSDIIKNKSHQRQSSGKVSKELRKIPYLPLIGTDGSIFWAHSVDKIVFWRYRMEEFYNPQVFCILNFEKQIAPISAIYATQIRSSIFKNQRTILICIAFFNQLQFFSFDIEKYEKQFTARYDKSQKSEESFIKYVQKILIKVNSNFLIQKILIQNIPNHNSPNKNFRPLVIFTDGGKDIEIVDLQNISAYKSHSQYDPFTIRKRNKDDKNQNQIIKLLHCRDQFNPLIHYAFVLRKETFKQQIKPTRLLQKITGLFAKKYQRKEEMILTIYQWNEVELKNDTIWKKIWNPPRLKKIKQISSKDLQTRLKQNFFEFFKLNLNNEFLIADISLIERRTNYKIFSPQTSQGCYLKVTFLNGTSVIVSNFRTLTFMSKVKVNPYIQKNIPISSFQYSNYRKLLEKGKYLQNAHQFKSKFNCFINEPISSQKQPKYSPIDPVFSECNGLNVCEGKLVYQDQMQILYQFTESNSRKRIYELNLNKISKKKSFMIFEKSFITIVQTPNIAESLLLLGQLCKRYPNNRQKVHQYINGMFFEFSESEKINLIEQIFRLLIEIQSTGKLKQTNSENKIMFNELIKEFYTNQRNNLNDETNYIDQKDSNGLPIEDAYAYELNINKADYQNLVDYLLGSDVLAKQKQYLQSINSSYNGKTIKLRLNEFIFQFVLEILAQHGLKAVSSRHVKTIKNVLQIGGSFSKYVSQSVTNSNDQKYLTNLFLGMFQINQSFLTCSLSQYIMALLEPVFDTSYNNFNRLKQLTAIILEKLQQIKLFVEKFVQFCSFKNNKTKLFQETVLFCKSIQNSIPKISLLLKLFETLSQVEYYNLTLQNNHKAYTGEITLKNLFLKVGTKETLCRITVENLFDENSMLLDELEEKLPQLNEIKNLRFYFGWKKLNSKIIDLPQAEKLKPQNQESSWFSCFFKPDSLKKIVKKALLLESESEKLQQIQEKIKQEFLLIEKALYEFSFQDFQKYFIAKGEYLNFANIILSKIYFLQMSYLEFKNKYHFDEQIVESFQTFSQKQNGLQSQKAHRTEQNYLLEKRSLQNGSLNYFLKYEQKVCNHQKYLKTYQLIRFFNEHLLLFFDKAISVYKNEYQKVSKQLISPSVNTQSKWNLTASIKDSVVGSQNNFYALTKEIQALSDLLFIQGSEFIKRSVENKLKSDPILESFLNKRKSQASLNVGIGSMESNKNKRQEFNDIEDHNNFLVRNKTISNTLKDQQKLRLEEDRRRMYQQKIDQKISNQLKGQFVVRNDINWMRSHNAQSSHSFQNQYL